MAKISLVRLDSRLIHGQVITKWVKIAKQIGLLSLMTNYQKMILWS